MQFTPLEKEEQLANIFHSKAYQVILKHNPTCSISEGVYRRLQAAAIPQIEQIFVLEVPVQRELSNRVAGRFGVPHQSPQILFLRNGRCVYHAWGITITVEALGRALNGEG